MAQSYPFPLISPLPVQQQWKWAHGLVRGGKSGRFRRGFKSPYPSVSLPLLNGSPRTSGWYKFEERKGTGRLESKGMGSKMCHHHQIHPLTASWSPVPPLPLFHLPSLPYFTHFLPLPYLVWQVKGGSPADGECTSCSRVHIFHQQSFCETEFCCHKWLYTAEPSQIALGCQYFNSWDQD